MRDIVRVQLEIFWPLVLIGVCEELRRAKGSYGESQLTESEA